MPPLTEMPEMLSFALGKQRETQGMVLIQSPLPNGVLIQIHCAALPTSYFLHHKGDTLHQCCSTDQGLQTSNQVFNGDELLRIPLSCGLILHTHTASKPAFCITCNEKLNAFKRQDGPYH